MFQSQRVAGREVAEEKLPAFVGRHLLRAHRLCFCRPPRAARICGRRWSLFSRPKSGRCCIAKSNAPDASLLVLNGAHLRPRACRAIGAGGFFSRTFCGCRMRSSRKASRIACATSRSARRASIVQTLGNLKYDAASLRGDPPSDSSRNCWKNCARLRSGSRPAPCPASTATMSTRTKR